MFNFNFDRFLFSLQYMWKGMLCIFVVIAVIIISVYIISSISAKAEERKKAQEDSGESN